MLFISRVWYQCGLGYVIVVCFFFFLWLHACIFHCLPVHCFHCVVGFWFGWVLWVCWLEHNGARQYCSRFQHEAAIRGFRGEIQR